MEKIKKLKVNFIKFNIDGYIIPKNDDFFNEYTPKQKDYLKHITNFTGSYGVAIILKNKNFLLVDGRYSIQAKKQSGNQFKIITLPIDNLRKKMQLQNFKIGFKPRIFNNVSLDFWKSKLGCKFIPINKMTIFKDFYKEKKINKKFYFLDNKAVGDSNNIKITRIINFMKMKKIDFFFETASENIAWILNIRGGDSKYSPIPNAYLMIDKKKNVFLFCDLNKIDKKFRIKAKNFNIVNISYLEYFLKSLEKKRVSIDELTASVYFQSLIKKNNKIVNTKDPIYHFKSIKNKVELANTKKAHEYDGAALTKFLFWLKENYKKQKITELSAQNKLYQFKKRNKKFLSLSFPTISSTGSNGAIVHYNANKKTNKTLRSGKLYLVDSGSQYQYGTTDVTRTISLNNTNNKIKEVFTRILKGHLNVSNFKLKKNTTGSIIDKIARKYLKEINLDYAHGTGHGVGFFLNVHEGPQAISKYNKIKLLPGMILSNEPGYYKKGEYGIRIENLISIKKGYFENLTYVPIDKSLIIKKLLSKNEINWLNSYHGKVFKKLKKYMNKKEVKILKIACSKI